MPIRSISVILILIILFYTVILRLSSVNAEESTGKTQMLVPAAYSEEDRQPSITRNPFVNAADGRIRKARPSGGANTSSRSKNKDSEDSLLKSSRLKGVLIRNDKAVALFNHSVLGIGDKISGYTVTEISDDGVTLSKGDIVVRFTID